MDKKCFVIQRFDGGRYDRLYEQVFKPAIQEAGFLPYRVDQDPAAAIPIESIEKEISSADACFVELSEDAPNVWFELGYSIAREKPLCLVCSSLRARFPFDVQHRQIIRYPDQPLPSDFDELRKKIKDRLLSVLRTDVAMQQNTDAAKALSVAPELSGLKPHELLALTIIFQSQFTGTISGWSIKQEMERAGFLAVASGLAITGLKRKELIESEARVDDNNEPYLVYNVTPRGENWLIEHQDELNLKVEKQLTDNDVPF